jgi:hypothetical protein
MTPDEELAALRRLAELQRPAEPELSPLEKAKIALETGIDRAKTVGGWLGRGAVNTVGGLSDLYRKFPPAQLGEAAATKLGIMPPSPDWGGIADKISPIPENEPKLETYNRRMVEALPSMAFGGAAVKAAPALAAVSTMLPQAAGQAARDFSKPVLGEKNAGLADALAQVLTGAAVPYGAGAAGHPALNTGGGTVEKAAKDTGILTDVALSRASPTPPGGFDIAQTANKAAGAANKVVGATVDVASESMRQRLAGVELKPREVAQLYTGLKAVADSPKTPESVASAYREVMDSLLRQDKKGFLTDLDTVSAQLKRLKSNAVNPVGNASSAQKWGTNDMLGAVNDAEMMLGGVSPAFKRANEAFRAWHQDVANPLKEGTIGVVADKNPNIPTAAPIGRLTSITADRSPGDVQSTLSLLKEGGADTGEIARALLQKKLAGGPLASGRTAFGGPGSPEEAALTAALGPKAESIRAPLNAADTLASTLKNNNALTEYLQLRPSGVSVRGILRPGIMERFAGKADYEAQVHKLLSGNPTPEEIRKLQELSMFDPNLRAQLSRITGLSAYLNQMKEN